MIYIDQSKNGKTGVCPQTYTQDETCPVRCPFKHSGCYAECMRVLKNWGKTKIDGYEKAITHSIRSKEQLRARVEASINAGFTIIRHNVAGDICRPGTNIIDGDFVDDLTYGFCGVGYTYTHAEINGRNSEIIRKAAKGAFIINYSCETPAECQAAAAEKIPAVLAWDVTDWGMPVADGLHFVQCPQQTKGISCAKCRLCARAGRKSIVVFDAHSNGKNKARAAIARKNGIIPIKAIA